MRKKSQDIAIIGAGLAGCYLAILMSKKGYKVNVYEKASKLELIKNNSRRSYNLTLYGFAIKALKDLGIYYDIKPSLIKLKGSLTYLGESTQPTSSSFGKDSPYYAISRNSLLRSLLKKAEKQRSININYGKILIDINKKDRTFAVQDVETGKTEKFKKTIIIGADGVNSKVREFMHSGEKHELNMTYEPWEYKQIILSTKSSKLLGLKKNITYTWTKKNAVLSALPNLDGSFSAILILPKSPSDGFQSLQDPSDIINFIKIKFPSTMSVQKDFVKALAENPTGYFVTVQAKPWHYRNFMLLIGDSAHGMLPFQGQGASSAFGDAMEICNLTDVYGNNWKKVFSIFQKKRKQSLDLLVSLSRDEFIKYRRTKKADYKVIFETLEVMLYRVFPGVFAKPVFLAITEDPIKALGAYLKIMKQRRILAHFGFPVFVTVLTYLIGLSEKIKTIILKHKVPGKTYKTAFPLTKI